MASMENVSFFLSGLFELQVVDIKISGLGVLAVDGKDLNMEPGFLLEIIGRKNVFEITPFRGRIRGFCVCEPLVVGLDDAEIEFLSLHACADFCGKPVFGRRFELEFLAVEHKMLRIRIFDFE